MMKETITRPQPAAQDLQNEAAASEPVEIVYYTDPLCCWSWGMEPHWQRLRTQFGHRLRYRYCMGGWLPGWKHFTDEINSASRPAQMGPLWMEASRITGMPMRDRIWIENPPASSYLACMAVKSAGFQGFAAEENFLYRLREALMTQGRNIAQQSVLLEVAKEFSNAEPELFEWQQFERDLPGDRARAAFQKDLQEVQFCRIRRFPSLILHRTGRPSLLLTGYRPYEVLEDAVRQLMNV